MKKTRMEQKVKTALTAIEAKNKAQEIAFAPVVFQTTHCLLKFDVLSKIHLTKKRGVSFHELLEQVSISEYGLGVLLEMAVLADIVTKKEDVYMLSKVGYFLLKDPMTVVNFEFIRDVCYQGLFYLDDSIENGKPEGLKVLGDWPTLYEGLSKFPKKAQESWFKFDHFYSDDSFDEALKIVFENKPKHILDIGGNTGKWTRRCCEYNKEVQISILDLPGQLMMAQNNILEWGFADRVNFVPTDVLNPQLQFPNADTLWMSQFLDCFSKEQIVQILSHACKNMNDNTDVFIMETFWDNQKFEAASFSLAATSLYFTAIANGNSKMYGLNAFIELVEQAGLRVVKAHESVGICHSILQCRKA